MSLIIRLRLQPSTEVSRQDLPQETLRLQQGVDSLSQQCRRAALHPVLKGPKFVTRVCSILHNVVIHVVIESGINWNRDERLFALFMMDAKVRCLRWMFPPFFCLLAVVFLAY
jgi:hypothetical protein